MYGDGPPHEVERLKSQIAEWGLQETASSIQLPTTSLLNSPKSKIYAMGSRSRNAFQWCCWN